MVSWDDYRFFLALHRRGSMVKAARALRVDVTTARRRIAAIEEALGAQLFRRRREGVVLTSAGERLLAHAIKLEATALDIERDVGGDDRQAQGTVRLSAGEAFISWLVAPAVGQLMARHPQIALELHSDNRVVDLGRGEADLAIRLVRPSDEALVARKIATLQFGLYATRAYLTKHGRPASEAELAHHTFIAYDASMEHTPETQWLLARGVRMPLRANSPIAILGAAAAGHGIVAVSELFAARYRDLERLLPQVQLPSRDVWLVVHRELQRVARIRAVQEFVVQLFAVS